MYTYSSHDQVCCGISQLCDSHFCPFSCCHSTIAHEPRETERQGTTNSALNAVLDSMCPAHQSLVYRILRLAYQQKLLFFKPLNQVKPDDCCYCGKHFDSHICHCGATKDCASCGCCHNWKMNNCSSKLHPKDTDSIYNVNQFALKESEHETAKDFGQLCKQETFTNICPKKVHCPCCQCLSSLNMDNGVHSKNDPFPLVCCSKDNNQTCSHHLINSSLTEVNCTEDKSECFVLKMEHCPSTSSLSPDPSDLDKKSYKRFLCHCSEEPKVELVEAKHSSNANFRKDLEKKSNCKSTHVISKTAKKRIGILQDEDHLSDIQNDIKPLERGLLAITSTKFKNQQLFQRASESGNLNPDPELIDRQINNQAPNTRSRHRQRELAASGTPTETTSARQTQFKQKPANMNELDHKQNKSILNPRKSIFKKYSSVEKSKTVTKCDKTSLCCENGQLALSLSNNLGKTRKSRRTIVPPPRFSSYVTEPRKMYFVACFSDSIFNHRSQEDIAERPFTLPQKSESHIDSLDFQTTNAFSLKPECQRQVSVGGTKESRLIQGNLDKLKHHSEPEEITTMPSTCSLSHDVACVQYTSPIKLMFVSPVKDKEGVKYSLKSAAAVSGSQAKEYFDPCEESSWSGTPEKNTTHCTPFVTPKASPLKTPNSSANQVCLSPRSSPNKIYLKNTILQGNSECRFKSSTSSKSGSGRSNESMDLTMDANLRFPYNPQDLHETTSSKRRPGRPKKLGPHLEKTVKRPIGRPRKEKVMEPTVKDKSVKEITGAADMEENVNKNLKITVLYGRSRRNKRMVSEGFDQLQTEFHDACQAVGLNNNWSMLMNNPKVTPTDLKNTPVELNKEITLFKPLKVSAKSNIKCKSLDDAAPLRKPGRPAKVKISGISVTVTTVSPRQRKIQINKDKTLPNKHKSKKKLFQESGSAKESKSITPHLISNNRDLEQQAKDLKSQIEPNPPVVIRHSQRVRKPSINFLHAVATSSSYSRSSALVRRSKELLLNKTLCEQNKDESQNVLLTLDEDLTEQDKEKNRSQGLHQMSNVSVESIYSPKEVKWWSASIQAKTLNQEFARRIRRLSESWVSDTVNTEAGFDSAKNSSTSGRIAKHSSVVRSLFDCSPNKPRSCSMQQLRSWFMQTTETQSLTIVKKASSRNSFEIMHFPRSSKKRNICYSPQAERLRKHLKKFAKSVPKSPYDFKRAQRRLYRKNWYPVTFSVFSTCKINESRSKSLSTYRATLHRAKTRYFTKKERRMNHKTCQSLCKHTTKSQTVTQVTRKTFPISEKPLNPVHTAKDYLYSTHASPDKLKECRVFLRKINSLNNGSVEEERNCSTITLEDGSPLLGKREKKAVVDQAVKTNEMKISKRTCLRKFKTCSTELVKTQHMELKRARSHSVGVVPESAPLPPAKRLRQSRMMGLSGPRWRDFVFGH